MRGGFPVHHKFGPILTRVQPSISFHASDLSEKDFGRCKCILLVTEVITPPVPNAFMSPAAYLTMAKRFGH